MGPFEQMLRDGIQANVASLKGIAECGTLDQAKCDGVDAIEGFLRHGYDKSLSWGEDVYLYLRSLK